MSKSTSALALFAIATMLHTAASLAADAAASGVSDAKDLTAVIALQGLPCGQVLSAVKQGDDAFLATCQDGNRYRVFVNPDGRVIVEKVG